MAAEKGPQAYSFPLTEMVAVSREEFIPGRVVPADVFVQLSQDKYVMIARQGTKAAFNELHIAERDDIVSYYLRKEDYRNCVAQNLSVAGILMSRADIPDEAKVSFLARTADSVFKEIGLMGFQTHAMEHSKQVAANIRTLVAGKDDLRGLMSLLDGVSNNLVRHSMAVSAIAVMIAKGLDWVLPATLEKLALGGLLHDVGMKELPPELLEKPRHMMTPAEVELYESHVFRGVEILRSMPSISDDLVSMVFEHHENALGLGYPRKIRDLKMQPLSRIIALADAFADLTLENSNNAKMRTAEEAIEYIEVILGQPYSRQAFQGLKQILQISAVKK